MTENAAQALGHFELYFFRLIRKTYLLCGSPSKIFSVAALLKDFLVRRGLWRSAGFSSTLAHIEA